MAEYNNQSGKQDKKKDQTYIPEQIREFIPDKQIKKVIYEEEKRETILGEQDKYIKEANKKLKESTDYFLKTSSTEPKKKKKKKKKSNIKLTSPKFNLLRESPELDPTTEPPAHCWTIEKIMVNGTWMTPQFPWACADIQTAGSFAAFNATFGFPTTHQFSMHGPFIVANLCQTNNSGFPLGSTGWWNYMQSNPVDISLGANDFYDWVVNHPNNTSNTSPVIGDHIVIHENGPTYITADTIDNTFPTEPIEAFCLRYSEEHYSYVTDDISTTGIEGYQHIFCLANPSHNTEFVEPIGPEECRNPLPHLDPNPCGEVGSVNPETGGIVFSIEQGPNQTIWYEVAPSDVVQTVDINGMVMNPIPPGGTPSAAIGTNDCGVETQEICDLHHTTSQGFDIWDISTGTTTPQPAQGPQWTNMLADPQTYLMESKLVIGIGPGSDNPQIDSSNYMSCIQPGTTTMHHYDENGHPCYLYDVSSGIADCQGLSNSLPPTDTNRVTSVTLIPAFTPVGPAPPNPPLYRGNHPFDTLVIEGLPHIRLWTWSPSIPCPGHAVVPPPYSPGSCPNCTVPVWRTRFINTTIPGSTTFLDTGLEWGVFNQNVTPSTSAAFSGLSSTTAVGRRNTSVINNYAQNTIAPYQHPVGGGASANMGISTRYIAAEEAMKYSTSHVGYNQIPLGEDKGWFLPSLDEFIIMIGAVGPDSSVWSNPLYQTQYHVDFQNSFYNQSNGFSENIYWTSSEDDVDSMLNASGVSSYSGPDPNNNAIAVELSPSGPNTHDPTPLFTSRCHPLTTRPIRKYVCIEEPIPEYNYRDSHNIWIENDGEGGQGNGGEQSLTPFVSIFSPGGASSSESLGEPGVIGYNTFRFGLTTTDVMGNDFALSHPFNDAFTNIDFPATQSLTRNVDGFIVTLWDNQKNFIGKWHYRTSTRIGFLRNRINYKGYLEDCASHPNPTPSGPNQNCNPSPTYSTISAEFPDKVTLNFSGVTHLAGPHPIFRYGGNREEAARRHWTDPTIPFTDWHHPYMENAFNGWTSSYAYMKIECQTTQAIGANAYNPLDGPNTDIDSMEVRCLRNLFLDEYLVENDVGTLFPWSPPNPNLNPTTGSLLGCGDASNHDQNDPNSQGGGYGWQWAAGPPNKGNSAFGDVYGINYCDGRIQETGYATHNLTGPTHPNLALHPKHWVFPWHSAYPPTSGGTNWYKDLHEGYQHCYGYRCKYNLGDTGPAGGIIVGVPGMIGNEVVPGGASSNESEWYYEMSPEDLGTQSTAPIEWGNWEGWFPYPNVPMSADQVGPWVNLWPPFGWIGSNDDIGGNINQGFDYYNPYTPIGSGIAETTIFPGGFCELNPPGGPYFIPSAQNAHILCKEYETYDQFGFRYCDWYLPNIQESWYIINNAPSGTFAGSNDVSITWDLYWTSNRYDPEPGDSSAPPDTQLTGWPGWDVLAANTMYDHGGTFVKGVPTIGLDRSNAAYAYNVAKKIRRQGPILGGLGGGTPPISTYPQNWQPLDVSTDATYVVKKSTDLKVRAIRRFKCQRSPCQGEVSNGGPPGT